MAKSKIAVVMTGEEADLWRKTEKLIGQQVKLRTGYKNTGNESKQSSRKQEQAARAASAALGKHQQAQNARLQGILRAGTQIASALGVGSGIAGALAIINARHEAWLNNINQVANATKAASRDIIAFAALQEGGTKAKRVQEAAAVAAQYGIMDRGQAFDVQQAMQSRYGIAEGRKASETIFAATQLGVELQFAKETEVMGGSQGQAPGSLLRKMYVAGQASVRDPNLLAKAGPGLKYYEDKAFGAAAAATIAGGVLKTQPLVYTKRAGQALSKTGTLAEVFEEWGMADATQKERVEELNRRGLISIEKLQVAVQKATQEKKKSGEMTAGKSLDIRQAEAVADLAKNLEEINRIEAEVRAKAKPGLFKQQRGMVENELPLAESSRMGRRLDVMGANWIALGPESNKALREQNKLKVEAVALARLGLRYSGLGQEYYSVEEGTGRIIPGLSALERFNLMGSSKARLKKEKAYIEKQWRAGKPLTPYPTPSGIAGRRRPVEGWLEEHIFTSDWHASGPPGIGPTAKEETVARWKEMYPKANEERMLQILTDESISGERRERILEQMLQHLQRQASRPTTLKRPDDDR